MVALSSPTSVANIAGGIASQIPYQTAANTTAFIPNGTSTQVLQSNGTSAPSWVSQSALTAGTATNATNLATSNFTITESGGKLLIKYGATTLISIDSSGNMTTIANVTAYGTP